MGLASLVPTATLERSTRIMYCHSRHLWWPVNRTLGLAHLLLSGLVPESRLRGLKCRECGARFPLAAQWVCDECFGPVEVEYDYAVIREMISPESIARGPATIWRYRDLLPIENAEPVDIGG